MGGLIRLAVTGSDWRGSSLRMGYVEAYPFHFFPAAELYTDEVSLGIHASHWLSHFEIAVEGHCTFPFTFT